jgi:hypothetical protein
MICHVAQWILRSGGGALFHCGFIFVDCTAVTYRVMMNVKGFGMKRPLPNLGTLPGFAWMD